MLEEWDRRRAALTQVRVADVERPVLERADDHHLRQVLRARVGEEVVVTDGRGAWRLCRVGSDGLDAVSERSTDPRGTETTLYLSPLKGDRDEWALVKAVELGVSRVVPLLSQRLAVRYRDEARRKSLARWRRLALEAAGQCRRTYDLEVLDPVSVNDVPDDVAVCDFGGSGSWAGVRALAIGPEGGFSPDEWGPERRRVSLGQSVLRAETAAVVGCALMTLSLGDWGFTLEGSKNG